MHRLRTAGERCALTLGALDVEVRARVDEYVYDIHPPVVNDVVQRSPPIWPRHPAAVSRQTSEAQLLRRVGPGRHSLASGALMSAPLSSSSLTMAADCGCPVGPHAQMSAVLPPAATVARSKAPYERTGRGTVAHDCPSR